MNKRIAALILAAGYSSRMGEIKALLPFDNELAIERQIKCFLKAGVPDIFVVAGYKAAEIYKAVKGYKIKKVYNDRYAEGMFTSIQAGIKAAGQKSFDGIFLSPVDQPLLQPYTLETLTECFCKGTAKIVYPCYQGKKGHPPLFSAELFKDILAYRGQDGMKGVFTVHQEESEYVQMGNPSCLMDMDTKADYLQAICYLDTHLPDRDECEYIYNRHRVPEEIREHCKKVSQTAKAIAIALYQKKIKIDTGLVYCSAMLHDICKGEPDHASKAAELLTKMDYRQLASPIRNHMDIDEKFAGKICNESVLYLADKIVRHNKVVQLDARFWQMESEKKEYAKIHLIKAIHIQEMIEAVLGVSLMQLLGKECG